jgi:hypothetical protein
VIYVWSFSELEIDMFDSLGILLVSITWPFALVVTIVVAIVLIIYDMYYSLKGKLKQ